MILDDDQIETDYHIWKKNAPYLYDILFTQKLDWPSLTVQWLPESDRIAGESYTVNKVLYGTNTSGLQENYLILAKVKIPQLEDKQNMPSNKPQTVGITQQLKQPKVQILAQIYHEGEVNRARYNPSKYNIIATKTVSGQVHIFDYTKHKKQTKVEKSGPLTRLVGHNKEGFALSWNHKKPNILVSAGLEGSILMFDAEKSTECVEKFEFHDTNVGDLSYHKYHGEIFCSGDDAGNLVMWDARNKASKRIIRHLKAHEGEIYSIDFSRKSQYLLCSGGSDRSVKVWDLRVLDECMFSLVGHQDSITKVEWSPQHTNTVVSSSADRRLHIWDLSKAQKLRYVHAGHRSGISDFDVNMVENDTYCSVDQNNQIHVFKPNSNYNL